MSRHNTPNTRPVAGTSPVTAEPIPGGVTYEGGAGYSYDARSELFLLAVSSFSGEDKFYETAHAGDARFVNLVRQVAVEDPDWVAEFLRWLRSEGNIRTAAVVGAAEYAVALLSLSSHGATPAYPPQHTIRQVIDYVLRRADEPGEFIAYWRANVRRALPGGVQRGLADAVRRLYTQRALLKYDTSAYGYRFGDVVDLVHPSPVAPWQGFLFEHALDRRHGRVDDEGVLGELNMIRHNRFLRAEVALGDRQLLLDPEALQAAGMTWEDALSLAGSHLERGPLWEALVPSMGYMALLRNLRNFDEAGVSDEVARRVAARLADPEEVARSRQLPMRFLAAHRETPSLRWAWALEQALDHSLGNVPELRGRTLIMVDTSSSMNSPFSRNGKVLRWDAAVVFGLALARRCQSADVVSFSSAQRYHGDPVGANTKEFVVRRGESLLRAIDRWKSGGWFLGGGTATALALRKHHAGHDRVVVLTDEQANRDSREVHMSVPERTPLYTWNLAGYERGHAPAGTPWRHTFGGLTDAGFRAIPLIEAGRAGAWPWQTAPGNAAR